MKPEPTFSWDEIEEIRSSVVTERPGPEWFTREEYQKRFSISRSTAQEQLQKLVGAGKIEYTGNSLKYYRVKKEGKCT